MGEFNPTDAFKAFIKSARPAQKPLDELKNKFHSQRRDLPRDSLPLPSDHVDMRVEMQIRVWMQKATKEAADRKEAAKSGQRK